MRWVTGNGNPVLSVLTNMPPLKYRMKIYGMYQTAGMICGEQYADTRDTVVMKEMVRVVKYHAAAHSQFSSRTRSFDQT